MQIGFPSLFSTLHLFYNNELLHYLCKLISMLFAQQHRIYKKNIFAMSTLLCTTNQPVGRCMPVSLYVMCCWSVWSSAARNCWNCSSDFFPRTDKSFQFFSFGVGSSL